MLSVRLLNALLDNYVFIGVKSKEAFVIDPGESEPVERFIKSNQLDLRCIMITHHHFDHVGGVPELQKKFKNIDVFVPKDELDKIKFKSKPAPERFSVCGLDVKTIELPGHTVGHVGFYFPDEMKLFCGDVLFCGGCGKIFEGTTDQMFESLNKIANMSPKTQIYCGHEYTINNLKFALTIESDNHAIKAELKKAEILQKKGKPTIPTSVEKEKLINPFLRTQRYIKDFSGLTSKKIFAHIRALKDNFC